MKKLYSPPHHGYSLIEILMTIAVLGAIVSGIGLFFQVAQTSSRVTQTAQDLKSIRVAAGEWVLAQPSYQGITYPQLQSANLLPTKLNKSSINPWGGVYGVTATTTTPYLLIITVSNIPEAVCENQLMILMQSQVSTVTPSSCSNGTYTGYFD